MKIVTLLFALALLTPVKLSAFDHSHSEFTAVLQRHVDGEHVDYAGLKKSPDELGAYLESLAEVSESEFRGWNDNQEMAYLINLYNAATLKLIIDHYPLKSIKDIGRPWKRKVVNLFGKDRSLDYVEHDVLRKNYSDPRIHFGVNCASVGCPPLRAEAFQPAKLDKQLDEQATAFLNDTDKNRVDAGNGVLYLSSIFDWFKGDFVKKSGSVEKFVAPYFGESDRKAILGGNLKLKYTDYDWSLNEK